MTFDYEINAAFPAPKANNLEKIAAVVDVVDAGCNTGESVADALDIETREGSYYGDAAGYLGLVDVVSGEAVKTYHVTAQGYALMSLETTGRVDFLKRIIADSPLVQVYAESGNAGVMDVLTHDMEYAEATAVRRAACIASWHNQSGNAGLGALIGATVAGAQSRAVDAAKRAAEVRKARIEAATPTIRSYGTCLECFTQLPASGSCDCDS